MALTIAIEGKGVIANSDSLAADTAGGSWVEDGAGSMSLSTETYLFGSSCVAGAYSNKAGWLNYNIGSGNELDFTPTTGAEAGQHIYMWVFYPTPGLGESMANDGFQIRIGTDASNYRTFIVSASDNLNGWYGDWKCFVVDPTKSGSIADTGTFNIASVARFGCFLDATGVAKGDNLFIDQIAVGKGLRITGTSTTGWKDIMEYCTNYPNRAWGMVQEREGIYYVYGKIYIGETTQSAITDFADSGRVLQFGKSEYWSGTAWITLADIDCNGIVVEDNATYATIFEDGVLVGSDNGRSGSTIIGNSNHDVSLDLYGGNNASSETLCYGTIFKEITGLFNSGNDTGHKFLGCAVLKCSQFDPVGGPILRNCTFAETIDVDSALLWNENIDIELCTFIANTLGAAINMPSSIGTPYDYTTLLFSGNTYDVLNSSGSAITVNKLSNSNPSTYEGSAVTFSATYAHTIKGLELNTEVTYVTAGTSTELYHVENATTADGDGKYKTTYSHSGGANVDILIFHTNYKPDISDIMDITLGNSDETVKVQMFEDINYYNPA